MSWCDCIYAVSLRTCPKNMGIELDGVKATKSSGASLRLHDEKMGAENEGTVDAGGGCGTPQGDGARQGTSGKEKRIGNSVNICDATPLVSQRSTCWRYH